MLRRLYTICFYLMVPVILLRLLWRARRAPDYARRWCERFGFVPVLDAGSPVIWIHAVSVGETLAAVPLIRALQKKYPSARLVVTTTTPTGSQRVRAALSDNVYHVYAPYDLPDVLARFHRRVRPNLSIIMEVELWPNLIHSCYKREIPVILANARLSENSLRGYGRLAGLTRNMLGQLSAVAAQYEYDGERFVQLGLPPDRLEVVGNIKFDCAIDDGLRQKAMALKRRWKGSTPDRPVWLAASTHRGEEEVVLDAFAGIREKYPELLLVLVPRHPERFEEVAQLCGARGFSLCRHSSGVAVDGRDILLGDTIGELLAIYGACDIAFVGGSLVPAGCHNLIEPAAWGVPAVAGPDRSNFLEASKMLTDADALVACRNSNDLATQVLNLLDDPAERERRGNAARAVVEENRGVLERLLAIIERQLD